MHCCRVLTLASAMLSCFVYCEVHMNDVLHCDQNLAEINMMKSAIDRVLN